MPDPSKTPPQEAVYQNQLAPAPKVPPLTVSVEADPEQIAEGRAVIEPAMTEFAFIEIVILAQGVVLQLPSALT